MVLVQAGVTSTEDYSIALGCLWFADLLNTGLLDIDEPRTNVNEVKCADTIALAEEHGVRIDFGTAFETLVGCIDAEIDDFDAAKRIAQRYAEIKG